VEPPGLPHYTIPSELSEVVDCSQKMKPGQRIETTQRTPPFAFADNVLSFYAEDAKAYWSVFGPLGQPVVQTVEVGEGLQILYLEAVEAIFVQPHIALMQRGRTPPQGPGRPLLLDPSHSWDLTIEC
jgi:hypothetical protein